MDTHERRTVTITEEQLQALVDNAVRTAIDKIGSGLPVCSLQSKRIERLEEDLDKALTVLLGNGSPEHGLVYKFSLVEKDVHRITSGLWAFVLVAIGLIVTSVWNIILVKGGQ